MRPLYGESTCREEFTDDAALLACLWNLYQWETGRSTYPEPPNDLDRWKLILRLAEAKVSETSKADFHALLYAIIKNVQREPGLHLHRSLADPDVYEGLHKNQGSALSDFYKSAADMGLLVVGDTSLALLPALGAALGERDPRLTNIIRVYANEIVSLTPIARIVAQTVPLMGAALGQQLYDDELRSYQQDKRGLAQRMKPARDMQEQNSSYGAAALILPQKATRHGVVLVHGVLASPAELKDFAYRLAAQGHPVICVRLKGHGTVPEDLHDRSWQEWLSSVRRGYEIMSHIAGDVSLVGFATGASLALLLASEKPQGLASVVAVSAPLKFRARGLRYAPVLDFANTFSKWLHLPSGVKPFQRGQPEHPEFEHSNMPVHALAELHKVARALHQNLPLVSCPVMIIHGSNDPVVDPASALMIHERVGSLEKRVHLVTSDRHSILHENIGNTQEIIIACLAEVSAPITGQIPENAGRRMLRDWNLLRWAAPRLATHRTVVGQNPLDQS